MKVGLPEGAGEEAFDVTVCTPEWLAAQCHSQGGVFHPRPHLVVTWETFDQRAVRAWLEARVQEVEGATWSQLSDRLGRIAHWEFEDHRP